MPTPLALKSKRLESAVKTTNKNHWHFQTIELGGVFTQTNCNTSATTLVGSSGGRHQEDHGAHGAVALVWRCNNCTVAMHNESLNLGNDRHQALELVNSLIGPVDGGHTGISSDPLQGGAGRE
jgi:hypothetical protein